MKDTKQSDNRRDFLRDSSLMLATAIPAGLAATAQSLASTTLAAKPAACRIGLIGCGKRGVRAAMDALAASEHCRLIALADAFSDRLHQSNRALKSRFPDQLDVLDDHRIVGPHAAEKLCQTNVDAVILAAPPRLLPAMVDIAVKAHKHVFVEMPVAVDIHGVRQFMAAGERAREQETSLIAGLQRRSSSDYVETLERLREGAIGEPLFGRAYCNVPQWLPGERGKQQSLVEHKLRNWRAFEDFSGGPLVEELAHNLDVFNWLMGEHPWTAELAGGAFEFRHRLGNKPGVELASGAECLEFQYRNGFRLLCNVEQNHPAYASGEWVFGTQGYSEISQGKIFNNRDQLVWRSAAPRDGFAARIHELLSAIASGAPRNDTLLAADATLSAILGRTAIATSGRCRWGDLQRC